MTLRLKPPTPYDYRYWYDRGWRYSASPSGSATLDYLDSVRTPNAVADDALYDGYLDYAAGRPKWHSYYCRLNGGCEEHKGDW